MFRQPTAIILALILPASFLLQACGMQPGVQKSHVTATSDPATYTGQTCAAQGSTDTNGALLCDNVPPDTECDADPVCKQLPEYKKPHHFYQSPWVWGPVAAGIIVYGALTYHDNSGDNKKPGIFRLPGGGCLGKNCNAGSNLPTDPTGVSLGMWGGTAKAHFKSQSDPVSINSPGSELTTTGDIENDTDIISTNSYGRNFNLGKQILFCMRTGARITPAQKPYVGSNPSNESTLQFLGTFDHSLQRSVKRQSFSKPEELCNLASGAGLWIAFSRDESNTYLYDSVPPQLIGFRGIGMSGTYSSDPNRIIFDSLPATLTSGGSVPKFSFGTVLSTGMTSSTQMYDSDPITNSILLQAYNNRSSTDYFGKMQSLLGFITPVGTDSLAGKIVCPPGETCV